MALTPLAQINKKSCIENHKNDCLIAKSSTINSLLLGDSYDKVCKKYFSDILNFGLWGDLVENIFWRVINMSKIPYLEHVIISCGTDNINKHLPFQYSRMSH